MTKIRNSFGDTRFGGFGPNGELIVSSGQIMFGDASKGVFVAAVAGQSNAVGQGLVDGSANGVIEPVVGNVYSYTHLNTLINATEPMVEAYTSWLPVQPDAPTQTDTLSATASTPGHGFSVTAGKSIASANGEKVILVSGAAGSTTMADWMPSLTDDYDTTTLFGNLNTRIRNVVGTTGAPDVLVWYQGETDAIKAGMTKFALAHLHQIFREFRRVWGSSLPIIVVQLANHSTLATSESQVNFAEYQRQSEADYGASGTVGIANLQGTPVFTATSANVTSVNSGVITSANGGKIRLTGDGSAAQGLEIQLTGSTSYIMECRVDKNPSNLFDIWLGAFATEFSAPYLAGGSWIIPITTDASGKVRLIRTTPGLAVDITAYIRFWTPTNENIKLANTYIVVAHDLPRFDAIHLSTPGQKELGRRIGMCYRQRVRGDVSVDGAGPRFIASTPVTKGSTTTTVIKYDRSLTNATINAAHFIVTDTTASSALAPSSVAISTTTLTNDTVTVTHAASALLGNSRTISYGMGAGPAANTYKPNVIRGLSPDPLGIVLGLPAPTFFGVAAV